MSARKDGRGGRRPGAGRPKKPGAFEEAVYLRLPGALVAIYDTESARAGEPRAELMRRALERGAGQFPAPSLGVAAHTHPEAAAAAARSSSHTA